MFIHDYILNMVGRLNIKIPHYLSLWKSMPFNCQDNNDDVHHSDGEADAESSVVQDARRSGVFLCYLLLSGHVSISSCDGVNQSSNSQR